MIQEIVAALRHTVTLTVDPLTFNVCGTLGDQTVFQTGEKSNK